MKKLLSAILSICVMASTIPALQFRAQAAEGNTRYIVYEQDMEEQTIEEILPTLNKAATAAGYELEQDVDNPDNTVLALVGNGGRFEIHPPKVCTGTEITLEYRFKFREGTSAQDFELMRAFGGSSPGGTNLIYNSYARNTFYYRDNGGNYSTGKSATPGMWYRYVITLKNLPSETATDKVFDHTVYEQQADGTEKVLFSYLNKPITNQNKGFNSFYYLWVDTMNRDNLLFDDFRVYSNNEADLSEEYRLRNDRRELSYSDLTDEASDQIASDLNLPFAGQMGSYITWTSSNPEIIDPTTGVVTRQVDAANVTLTAHLSRDGVDKTYTKDFALTVLADTRSDEEVVADRASRLDLENKDIIMSDFPLPDTAGYRTTVEWSADPGSIIEVDGYGAVVTRPAADTKVTLHAVVSRGDAQTEKDIEVTVLKKGIEEEISNPYEDFEKYNDESEMKSWILNNAEIVAIDGTSALKLSKSSESDAAGAVLDFSQQADNTVFDVRLKSTVEDATLFSLLQDGNAEISFANEGGSLTADVCGIAADLGEFLADEWFTVKVEVNYNTRMIDIYVNGEKRTGSISVGKQLPAINQAAFDIPAGIAGETYINYFKGYGDFYRDLNLTAAQFSFDGVDRNAVKADFNLPTTGVGKTKVAWTSSDPSVIDVVNGVAKVTRPTPDMPDTTVTLTAKLFNALVETEGSFDFTVSRSLYDEEVIALDLPTVTVPEEITTSDTKQIYLPTSGENGSVMKWESSNTDVIGTDGNVYSIGHDGSDVEEVTLTLTISCGKVSQTKIFKVLVNRVNLAYDGYAVTSTSQSGHAAPYAVDNKLDTYWLSAADDVRPSLRISLKNAVTFNQLLLTGYGNSTLQAKVEYSKDNVDWRPLCNISGLNEKSKLYEFDAVTAKYLRYTVTKKTLEAAGLYEFELYYDEKPGDMLAEAVEAVTIENSNKIREDFELPLTGLHGVKFEWESENESIIKIEGGKAKVIRPENDTTVELILTASLSGETMTAMKPVTVKGTGSGSGNSGGNGSSGGRGNGVSSGGNGGLTLNLPDGTEVATTPRVYYDVADSHWAKQYIADVSAKGIMTGKDNNLFEPDTDIKREEFVKVLVLSFGFELTADTNVEFADVDKNSWSYPYIATAKMLGIVNGISESEFGTSMSITREDMAVMVVRAARLTGKTFDSLSSIAFADGNEISDYAKESVQILAEASILSGVGQNMFAPQQSTSRAEIAKIICLLDK